MTAMRVAYIGATPLAAGGQPYVATQVLTGLAAEGVELECFVTVEEELPAAVRDAPRLRLVTEPVASWAWLTEAPLVQFLTWQVARLLAQRRLVDRLVREHRRRPYDAIYQCSQIEMPALGKHLGQLPPVILHPGVHAAGQLRQHRREAAISRRCEPLWQRVGARAMLRARAAEQRRVVHRASGIITPSRRFARLLEVDYGVPRARLWVVPNPIDLARFHPPDEGCTTSKGRRRILFVSRLAAGKGTEMVVALSHRLADLRDSVEIEVIGRDSMWSDYRPLLGELNPAMATYSGAASAGELAELYRRSELLVQPSHCDAFGLTVGEALASGLPVVASDAVGAIEGVDPRCCSVFPAGDADRFERAVRDILAQSDESRASVGRLARAEASRLFAVRTVAREVIDVLEAVARSARDRTGSNS